MKVITNIENVGLDKVFFDRWAREVVQALYASNVRRVHNSGQAVDGSSIGHYSIKPIYVNPKNSPVQFTPKTTVKKNPKTKYFPGGYKEFRGSIGRTETPVNLQLSGRLKEDFGFVQEGENWALGFNSSYGEKLHHGLEDHFGKTIWGVTLEDERIIEEITDRYLKQYA